MDGDVFAEGVAVADLGAGRGAVVGGVLGGVADHAPGVEPVVGTDDEFAANTTTWRKAILEKGKSAKDLITSIQTKMLLTEDQKTAIDSWTHEND